MNKKFRSFFSLLLCLFWILESVSPVAAEWNLSIPRNNSVAAVSHQSQFQQAATPTPQPSQITAAVLPDIPLENVLTFEQLGKSEQFLDGPYDGLTMSFSLPTYWELTAGAQLDLLFSTSFNNLTSADSVTNQSFGGTLTITFNGSTVAILKINQSGDQTAHFSIPDDALPSRRDDGRHDLRFTLDSGYNCDINQQLTLIIKPASRLILPHNLVAPSTDLSRFPQTFIQDANWPDSAIIVLPEQPTNSELQSALTIAAGLSKVVGSSFALNLTTEGKLTAEEQAANHLILVGKAASFSNLTKLKLPAPITETGVNTAGSNLDDGVIELVLSPWNDTKVVLLVSGATDIGVTKASQAVSTGFVRPADKPNLAVIANVEAQPIPQTIPVDQTLADLGYDFNTTTDRLTRPGTTSSVFIFYTPTGTIADPDASFTLTFSHSALLNFNRSGLVVLLNDQPIGSFRFSENSAIANNTLKFQIPALALLPGRNRLEVRTNLIPADYCTSPQLSGLWVSIAPESILHLPTVPVSASGTTLYDLSLYPVPFTLHPTLGDTSFIVSKDDPNGWKTALSIATDLGARFNGKLITMRTYFADAIPDEVKSGDNLILVGRPSGIPMIEELHDQLPGPFEAGSEIAIEKNSQVAYRLGSNADVGYLELMRSPWNNERVIFAVLGNTDQGLAQAKDALIVSNLRSRLAGDFAIVTGTQIAVADTRIRTASSIDTTTQVSQQPVDEQPIDLSAYKAKQADWILPVLLGTFVLMIVVLCVAIINGIRRKTQIMKK